MMKNNHSIAPDAKGKGILQKAAQSSENEQMDLYKAIFGGSGADCGNVAISDGDDRASAYDKTDQFTKI